jgi:hypothetical protein
MLRSAYRKFRVHFGPRRFRAYGVGPGKSGTHSISNLFKPYYRTAHEPEPERALNVLMRFRAGTATEGELLEYLEDKDRRLGLEMDCASYNTLVAGRLAELYPRARFILSVRDCFTWANSAINQMLNNPQVFAYWSAWRTALYGRLEDCAYDHAEAILKQHGMWNLDKFYQVWADHYRTVLGTVPSDRLLLLRIQDLGQRNDEIAAFIGIEPDTLSTYGAKDFQTRRDFGLLTAVDPGFVTGRAQAICGDLMRTFYPDVACDYRFFR